MIICKILNNSKKSIKNELKRGKRDNPRRHVGTRQSPLPQTALDSPNGLLYSPTGIEGTKNDEKRKRERKKDQSEYFY